MLSLDHDVRLSVGQDPLAASMINPAVKHLLGAATGALAFAIETF